MCPIHEFHNQETGETISVYVPSSAPVRKHQVQKRKGKVYKRVYTAPLAAKDTRHKDATEEDFRRMTTDKKGLTLGQMWELSGEMSQHRADKNGGVDEVKEKFFRDYERKNKVKHTEELRRIQAEEARKRAEAFGIKIEAD